MGKGSLEQVVAGRVVLAIRAREHVLVSPGHSDALRNELEHIIAPSLHDWRANVSAATSNPQPASAAALCDHSHGGVNTPAERIADRITEQIHSSNHIDDIYAADGAIRRDALAAVRETLLGFMRGELPLVVNHPGKLTVQLDEFGDAARFISAALDADTLQSALAEAACRAGGTLDAFHPTDNSATFSFNDSHGSRIIALEEAIVARLLKLADSDGVELPAIEQLLSLSSGDLDTVSVQTALDAACARVRQHTGCVARCQLLDSGTLRVRLTPLTEASADRLDEHYDEFLGELQEALAHSAESAVAPSQPSAPASKRYPAEPREQSRERAVSSARRSNRKRKPRRAKR